MSNGLQGSSTSCIVFFWQSQNVSFPALAELSRNSTRETDFPHVCQPALTMTSFEGLFVKQFYSLTFYNTVPLLALLQKH